MTDRLKLDPFPALPPLQQYPASLANSAETRDTRYSELGR